MKNRRASGEKPLRFSNRGRNAYPGNVGSLMIYDPLLTQPAPLPNRLTLLQPRVPYDL